MAANDATGKPKVSSISKGAAKRKYLLTDEDLECINFDLSDNPLNKGYAPMKLFKHSEVEAVAIKKWGTEENIEEEQVKRRVQKVKVESKREDEKRQFWDNDQLHEPMAHFLESIHLPAERESPYFRSLNSGNGSADNLFICDVIICYFDCLHSVLPGAQAKAVVRRFPEARQVDKTTPFNDRRKMGYLSWKLVQSSADTDQVVVNLYVVHKGSSIVDNGQKIVNYDQGASTLLPGDLTLLRSVVSDDNSVLFVWNTVSKARASLPVLHFDALSMALRRLSQLLTNSVPHKSVKMHNLKIGTYIPYGINAEKFKETLQENLDFPVCIYSSIPES